MRTLFDGGAGGGSTSRLSRAEVGIGFSIGVIVFALGCGNDEGRHGAGGGGVEGPPPKVLQLTVGSGATCALLEDGRVKCWGLNGQGQLGLGDALSRGETAEQMGQNLPELDLGSAEPVASIKAGGMHTCALFKDAQLKCWGHAEDGQLGLGSVEGQGDNPGEMGDALAYVDLGVSAGSLPTAVIPGGNHTCAILEDGRLKCWGRNYDAQLGLGDLKPRGAQADEMGANLPFVDLGAGAAVKEISLSWYHTCALLEAGRVKCWGRNTEGQLGLGDQLTRGGAPGEMGDNLPDVDLGTGRTAVAVAVGPKYSCALLDDGSVKCWGENSVGQLGVGDVEHRGDNAGEMGDNLKAVDFGVGKKAIRIATGDDHACAILEDGSLKCWGGSSVGELGLGSKDSRGDEPGEMGDTLPAIDLGTGRTVTAVGAGNYFTCVLLDDSRVKCWGDGNQGRLGLGDSDDRGDDPGEMGDALPYVRLFSEVF